MGDVVNIYCDESCHLEHDGQPIMVLGAVWCPVARAREIAVRIREIKANHSLPRDFEIKWGKVSPARLKFYLALVDYFFDDDDLHFRALVATGKDRLRHQAFGQDHDTWYYKMYFELLKVLFEPDGRYRIYLDYKDTQAASKVRKLHDVLSNNMYDFDGKVIERVQCVRSHEVEQVQLADLLTGVISYVNRGLAESRAKTALVDRMRQRSQYTLTRSTPLGEKKVNLFRWTPSEV
ncbi:MAG: DUF3800 domain-containing protein [Sphaerobacter sp.]|nr:DUF3800 domain-containing protein [Sphaerobacter sp.]